MMEKETRYKVTQKAIDEGVYDEEGYMNIIASVPGYIEKLISNGYLVKCEEPIF